MGGIISQIRLSVEAFLAITQAYRKLSKKIEQTPGIPVDRPSTPYWAIPPSPIAHYNAGRKIPEYADVVILGSGITGTSVARELFEGYETAHAEVPLQVVMLEARDVCSGATARNGGHITPILYAEYGELKKKFGKEMAQKIIRFRLAHLDELIQVAREENLLEDSQARVVQTFDVFFDKTFFEDSKECLKVYLDDFPEEKNKWDVLEDAQAIESLQLSERVQGVISTRAGAIHPYRFVTGILSRLVKSANFKLFTHTPCTSIETVQSSSTILYAVETPRGTIQTPHVVHATNAWASHLLQPMRGKIVPARGNMTAQRPGQGLGSATPSADSKATSWLGTRSFVFYPGSSDSRFDYLTQQPPAPPTTSSPYPPPAAEFMFGGGFIQGGFAERAFFEEFANPDDSDWNLGVSAYLSGALSVYFGKWWGQEGTSSSTNRSSELIAEGRVMKSWGGIIGASADRLPWVGRVPSEASGRDSVTSRCVQRKERQHGPSYSEALLDQERENLISKVPIALAPAGEWIAAGFTGEGMVHAWLSGKALAWMMLDKDDRTLWQGHRCSSHSRTVNEVKGAGHPPLSDWLPDNFRISVKRWRKANIADV
ncbi:hypothetical protein VNI00_009086 [Paramarasmius palmivorus]|uniref:FAD dependent oxidoreductase domain-containing protein n=1 Tax=Paramarasmius palmivorus TaxID=297713 RepID=A0AAW0CRZ0_9AGAR